MSFLYILDINFLSVVSFENIFLPFLKFFCFVLLMFSFAVQKNFKFI